MTQETVPDRKRRASVRECVCERKKESERVKASLRKKEREKERKRENQKRRKREREKERKRENERERTRERKEKSKGKIEKKKEERCVFVKQSLTERTRESD